LSIVLDANALVVLALDRHRAVAVERLLREWQAQGEDLHAPGLLPYEMASALAPTAALGAELWTLDGPLARNAAPRGLPVKLIETASA
jgi:predicted nucleic acid-binding protein